MQTPSGAWSDLLRRRITVVLNKGGRPGFSRTYSGHLANCIAGAGERLISV
jgi:hypothetical protein